jgi:hypothetical protein
MELLDERNDTDGRRARTYLLYVDLIGSSPLVEKIGDDRVPRVAQRKEKVSHHE